MNTLNCHRCGRANAAGARACAWCGARVSRGAGARGQASRRGSAGGSRAAELVVDFPFTPFTSAGVVLGPTLRLYRENFLLVGKIVLVATLPNVLLQYALARYKAELWAPFVLTTLLESLVVNSLMAGALVYGVVTLLRTGASPPLAECYSWALRKWWKVLLCELMLSVIVGAGLMFLFVPGVFMLVVLAVSIPALVVEDLGPVAALERSGNLTSGYRARVFGTLLLLWAVIFVVGWLTGVYDAGWAEAESSLTWALLRAFADQMLGSASTVLSLFIYLGIRADKGETPAVGAYTAPQP